MEHYTCRNYLTWLTSLPWGVYSKDNLDLSHAESEYLHIAISYS